MARHVHTLGIDFGTSNSAAGFLCRNQPRLIEMAAGQTKLPSTFFFDFETRQTLIGEPANQALLDGVEGRFMRALKRVLGTSLMHEKRQILNERVTFVDIIALFLREIKTRAEVETGLRFERVLSGRPVVFHGVADPREKKAEADLRACYLAAGFSEVEFMAEPEAAAIACGALENSREIGIIVDIGGGTSDFSVFKSDRNRVEILASHGVRLGGTDFDRAISIAQVMPLLGKGTLLRNEFGSGALPAPNAIFNDLATWEKIPFLYTGQNRRMVADMARQAREPEKLNRLVSVLCDELGHELAFGVERGKIAANSKNALSRIPLDEIERGLSAPLPPETLANILAPHAEALRAAAQETLQLAGLDASQIDRVVYVGGSSLMSVVSDTLRAEFKTARHSFAEVFTAVADGLVRASAQMWR